MIDPIGLVVAIIIAIVGYRYAAKKQASRTLDGYALKKLEEAGQDLTQACEIEFWFYAEDESAITNLGNDLEDMEYQVYITETEQKPKFVMRALKCMLPEISAMQSLRKEFSALAKKYGAEYDGWGRNIL
jgi:regulator of RNase E activity RraB